ncbi:MAG: glycosyltransferase family 25 protein [Rhizobiales bacterium]|nr:glycosyltransferase family 25 protein [Hyphomicrobiales bacterium]
MEQTGVLDPVAPNGGEPGLVAAPPATVAAFVINLEKDRDRRDAILRQFDALPDLEPHVVEGVYGRYLPDSLCENLAKEKHWARNKGTIGCFLSHVKAWEEVAKLSDRFAVVLEDDVNIAGLSQLADLAVPDDAEIVFINDRMSGEARGVPVAMPMLRALQRLEASHGGPGGDGYLLTPAGARKLLAACATDFYFGHVDGRLLQYATGEEALAALPEKSWIVGVVRHHRHPTLAPTLGLLRGYTLSSPLVRHLGVPSIREAEDKGAAEAALKRRKSAEEGLRPAGLPIRYWTVIANAGDQINPYIIEAVAGRRPYFSPRRNEAHVLGIGSILFMATPQSHIWGSGILDPKGDYSQVSVDRVHAVRGRLTRQILKERHGLDREVPLGDPGIFADEIAEVAAARDSRRLKRRIGVIPHHRMIDHAYIRDITRHADAAVINPHLDCLDFISEIISSEIIASQSLHGLIFAQVFNKPFVWFSHTADDTWLFKFHDWFSNCEDGPREPLPFGTPLDALLSSARIAPHQVDREALRQAMPLLPPTERKPGIGYRETRRLSPLAFRITADGKSPVVDGYDATIVVPAGDEAALQAAIHAQARGYDDSFNLWLVYDSALFAGFTRAAMRGYLDILNELPDVHYLQVLPAGIRVPGKAVTEVHAGGRKVSMEARDSTYDGRGAVLVRNPFEFSFKARGRAIFVD